MLPVDVELPSNRKFGYFFTFVFALVLAYFLYHGSFFLGILSGLLGGATLATTILAPDRLLPFNRLWLKLGLLIGLVISPIVLGLIFFLLITPVALVTRWMGRDELRLKMRERASHWKERLPAGPEPESFRNQY